MTENSQSPALSGKLALVTGASRGIGAAIARSLAARGAHVVITARTAADLEQVEEDIHRTGGNATIAPLDLTDGDSIGRLAGAIGERWQALDYLVLNAATLGELCPVPAIDGKDFNRVITLNLLAPQTLIAAFDPMLRRSADAHLVAMTSSVGRNPRAYWGPYAASKAALENLVRTYGDEMANIAALRTLIVDPGKTRTAMRARAYPGEDPETLKLPEVVGEAIAQKLATDYTTGELLDLSGL